MLAIKLGHNECASLLMMHNANVNMEDNSGFNGIRFIGSVSPKSYNCNSNSVA